MMGLSSTIIIMKIFLHRDATDIISPLLVREELNKLKEKAEGAYSKPKDLSDLYKNFLMFSRF